MLKTSVHSLTTIIDSISWFQMALWGLQERNVCQSNTYTNLIESILASEYNPHLNFWTHFSARSDTWIGCVSQKHCKKVLISYSQKYQLAPDRDDEELHNTHAIVDKETK